MRSRKSATGTRENETAIKKGIAIETGTATAATGKRTETEIMTETATGTATETEIGIETETETVNVNATATAIVTVTVIANVIATRTETVVLGTTVDTKMAARATTDVTANGTGKVTRHETAVTEIEIDTRHGEQVLDGRRRDDALGRRRKIVAAMTNHEKNGSQQKPRSEARKCVRRSEQDSVNLFLTLTRIAESKVRHGGSSQGPKSSRRNARGGRDMIVYQAL